MCTFVLLLLVVALTPAAFTACYQTGWWCSIAYWATESGGKTGTMIILVITCLLYTFRDQSKRKKVLRFFKSFLVLGLILSGIAFFNEHVTKEMLAIARPSHLFIIKNGKPSIPLDSIYRLEDSQRKDAFRSIILSDSSAYQTFDPRILEHWIEESGYSFPSGHSFNAFILATILSFSMYHSRAGLTRKLYVLPFLWALLVAVSRVAVGAHSALDVSFGAGLGLLTGHLFLYFDLTREFIAREEKK